jgi:bifunctional DNase/RNase
MKEMLLSEIWSIIRTKYGNAILIKPKNLEVAIPIFIGALEMQSILIAHEKVKLGRPLTHDLFLDMLSRVNLTIKKIEISEIKNDTFHARLVITGGEYTNEKPLVLDSRPSDAFALVTRKRCPVYVSSSVIDQAAIPVDFFNEQSDDPDDKYRSLHEQLEQAVAEEEYERAAELRDMIKELNK